MKQETLLLGEGVHDLMYEGRKWHQYSGLFILLRQKIQLNRNVIAEIMDKDKLLKINGFLAKMQC